MKASDQPPKARDHDGLHRRRSIWYYTLNVNGARRFFSTKTHNYQEARKIRAKAEEDQKAGRLPNDLAKAPFETVLQHVLQTRERDLSENSRRIDKERSRALLKHFTGERVNTLTAPKIAAWQNARLAEGVSSRTINLEARLVRAVLSAAKVWAHVAEDYKPMKEDRRGPGKALESDQERLLLDVAQSRPGWEIAFLCALAAANTTMRGVELKTLRIGDVNLFDRELVIQRSKTDAGVRRIPMNAAALWAFSRLLDRAHALGAIEPEHFLLPAFKYRSKQPGHGNGYDVTRHQKTWRTAWRALVRETGKRAGREAAGEALSARKGLRGAIRAWRRAAAPFAGLRFHDLRHLAITKLAESQASDQTIMSISGHMDRAMLEHYSHIRADAKRAAVDAIPSYIPTDKTAAPSVTKSIQ